MPAGLSDDRLVDMALAASSSSQSEKGVNLITFCPPGLGSVT
jgi:hypothetical protein